MVILKANGDIEGTVEEIVAISKQIQNVNYGQYAKNVKAAKESSKPDSDPLIIPKSKWKAEKYNVVKRVRGHRPQRDYSKQFDQAEEYIKEGMSMTNALIKAIGYTNPKVNSRFRHYRNMEYNPIEATLESIPCTYCGAKTIPGNDLCEECQTNLRASK